MLVPSVHHRRARRWTLAAPCNDCLVRLPSTHRYVESRYYSDMTFDHRDGFEHCGHLRRILYALLRKPEVLAAAVGSAAPGWRSRLLPAVAGLVFATSWTIAGQASANPLQGTFETFPVLSSSIFTSMGPITRGAGEEIWFIENGEVGVSAVIGRMNSNGNVTGEFEIPTGTEHTLPELLSVPTGIAEGPDGDMWFTDVGQNKEDENFVGRVTPAGRFVEFPIPNRAAGVESTPTSIAAGPGGEMWFTEATGAIGRISLTGTLTGEFVIPTGTQPGMPEFSDPTSIAEGPDGDMWFTDNAGDKTHQGFIGRISPTGVIKEFAIPTPESAPLGIARGADGNMWFTEESARQIGRITPSGSIMEFPVPNMNPGAIVAGPDGNMWFTENGGPGAIGRITPTGTVTSFPTTAVAISNPAGIALGAEGDIWFSDSTLTASEGALTYHIWRFITPLAPVSLQPPTLSGRAVQGQALTVSTGTWENDPIGFSYQWQRCNAAGVECVNLEGEVDATHLLTAADVAHRLRVVVTANGTESSASVPSAVSAVVEALPPEQSLPPGEQLRVMDATLTWGFKWTRRYTTVESLTAHGVPTGGYVELICEGKGCAFAHRRTATVAHARPHARRCHRDRCAVKRPAPTAGELDLAKLFVGRRLHVATRISVSVIGAGWIGKSFLFTIRANRPPSVEINCLAPGSSDLRRVC